MKTLIKVVAVIIGLVWYFASDVTQLEKQRGFEPTPYQTEGEPKPGDKDMQYEYTPPLEVIPNDTVYHENNGFRTYEDNHKLDYYPN